MCLNAMAIRDAQGQEKALQGVPNLYLRSHFKNLQYHLHSNPQHTGTGFIAYEISINLKMFLAFHYSRVGSLNFFLPMTHFMTHSESLCDENLCF